MLMHERGLKDQLAKITDPVEKDTRTKKWKIFRKVRYKTNTLTLVSPVGLSLSLSLSLSRTNALR